MTETILLLAFLANGLLGLIAIPFYIRYAQKNKIVDVPNHRSSHTKITPRGGGVFIVFGSLLLGCLYLLSVEHAAGAWTFLAIAFGVALLGLVDDLRPLPSTLRLCIQFVFATSIFWIAGRGLQILPTETNSKIASLSTLFPWLAMGVFTIWIVGCLNIYNFMDGIDAIASMQGIAATVAWGIIAYKSQNDFALLFDLLLLGGLIAFLRYNWPPAKVFMGDCASSFLGFTFAALPLLHSLHTNADLWLSINLSVLMLFPFLFDGSFTLLRRVVRKENIFAAHRSHLYQRWTQHGASHRLVSSMYGLWAAIGGAIAILVFMGETSLRLAYGIVLTPGVALLLYSQRFSPRSSDR